MERKSGLHGHSLTQAPMSLSAQEPWLRGLLTFHVAMAVLTVTTTRSDAAQATLFLFASASSPAPVQTNLHSPSCTPPPTSVPALSL